MPRLALSVIVAAALMVSAAEAYAQPPGGYSYSRPRQSAGITWRNHRPTSSYSAQQQRGLPPANQQYLRPVTPQQRTEPLKSLTTVSPLRPVQPLRPLSTIGPLRPLSSSQPYRGQQTGGASAGRMPASGYGARR